MFAGSIRVCVTVIWSGTHAYSSPRWSRLEEANQVCESDPQLADFLRPLREGPLTPKEVQPAHAGIELWDTGDPATWIR